MLGLLRPTKKEEGTTLVELIVYMAILVVIIGGSYTVYDGAERIYNSTSGQADAQRSGRLAQANMTKYLRMADSFEQANDYSVIIHTDINNDRLWDKVSYYISGNKLYTQVNDGTAKEIASGVRNITLNQPLFIYYNTDGTAMTTDTASRLTKTYRMDINLVIDTDLNRPPGPYTLSSSVMLRNVQQ